MQIPEPVVVLRPVDEGDFGSVGHVLAGGDTPVQPKIPSAGRAFRVERHGTLLERNRMGRIPAQELAWPSGRQLRDVVAPEVVFLWLFNGMVLILPVFNRKADGK